MSASFLSQIDYISVAGGRLVGIVRIQDWYGIFGTDGLRCLGSYEAGGDEKQVVLSMGEFRRGRDAKASVFDA